MTADLTQRLWELALPQRWFSGRDGTPLGVDLKPLVEPVPRAKPRDRVETNRLAPALQPALLNVGFPDGRVERYLIPLLDGKDACDNAGILLDLLRAGAPGFVALREVPEAGPARRFAGEQSNTNVFFGAQVLMKLFRRIEPGENVDVELHRALAGTGVVAELYGTWTVDGDTFAVFVEALRSPVDGYDLATGFAARGEDFTAHARALGEALAVVHRTLAERLPTATISGEALADGCLRRFAEVAAAYPVAAPYADAVADTVGRIPVGPIPAQRVHGDCHLGQVLLTEGRWVYVDFEGEPLKPLAERRLPDSPLRDVAGMLRSFGYAAAAGPAPSGWLAACRRAFLEGYGLDPEAPNPVLDAYEIDKAGYEVAYESRYRPHLVQVPIDSLATLSRRSQ
ncbi:MAG TPA: phosphotransferase [Arachnia sp.]|nr:phosphotransferase [Arachnia sp.]